MPASPAITVKLDESKLRAEIKKFGQQALPMIAERFVRKVAFDATAATVVLYNGVAGIPKRIDTGRLRAGWRLAIEDSGASMPGVPGSSDPENASQAGDGTSEVTTRKTGASVVLANNVEYVREVEYGTAHMSPGRHVHTALKWVRKVVREGRDPRGLPAMLASGFRGGVL